MSEHPTSLSFVYELWGESEIAENTVRTLYHTEYIYHPMVGNMFLTGLRARTPSIPAELKFQIEAVTAEVCNVAIKLMESEEMECTKALMNCALQPLPHLKQPSGVDTLCSGLFYLYNHVWYTSLPRNIQYKLNQTYCKTLVGMPPDTLTAFWNLLERDEPLWNFPLLQTLDEICSLHSLNHLLYGLAICKTNHLRNLLVLALEKVGDPSCLHLLKSLEHQTACSDWPMARLISRAIHTIQRQYNLFDGKDLLLPANYKGNSPNLLIPR